MSEPTTLRDDLEAALEQAAPEAAPAAEAAPVEASPEIGEIPEIPETEGETPANLEEMAEGEKPETEQQQRDRDEQGKFKAKEMTPGPKSGPKVERAPASWKPEAREHWSQLPEGVRAEVARREAEVTRTLQESAEARKNYDAVMRTVAPYEAFIRAEGSNPIQAIDNLMATAAKLRTGTAPELAQMVAGIVNQFGIGRFGNNFIELLDGALAGQAPKEDPQQTAIEQVLNQKLAPVQQMLTQFQQLQANQMQQVQQSAAQEVNDFLSKVEFGNDVREDMADIIEAAQRRGQNISLQDAYRKAVMMNDEIRSVLTQRSKSQGVQQQTQAAQKARAAAVSVSGSAPMGALRQDPTDIRSAIEAAIVQSSR